MPSHSLIKFYLGIVIIIVIIMNSDWNEMYSLVNFNSLIYANVSGFRSYQIPSIFLNQIPIYYNLYRRCNSKMCSHIINKNLYIILQIYIFINSAIKSVRLFTTECKLDSQIPQSNFKAKFNSICNAWPLE